MPNLPRDAARLGSVLRLSDGPIGRYRSTGHDSPAAERLVRGARVLHAERQGRALLRRAEHVRGLDVHLVLAATLRGAREGPRLVGETDLDNLAVARDAVLDLLDRS